MLSVKLLKLKMKGLLDFCRVSLVAKNFVRNVKLFQLVSKKLEDQILSSPLLFKLSLFKSFQPSCCILYRNQSFDLRCKSNATLGFKELRPMFLSYRNWSIGCTINQLAGYYLVKAWIL